MYFFTADEHYAHKNIIIHCKRPFVSTEEMDSVLIENHNSVVKPGDTVIHGGDFCFTSKHDIAESYLKKLNGNHIVLRGSHDYWLKDGHEIWEKKIDDVYVVVCHYAMRVWPRSHFNSWQLYGHSHGRLDPAGKQWDVGVDNNNYHPVSFEELKKIMSVSSDNPNRLFRFAEGFSVSRKFFRRLDRRIMEAFESIKDDYGYEYKYISGSIISDGRKIRELSHLMKMCDLITSLYAMGGTSSSAGEQYEEERIQAESLNAVLDFNGSDSNMGKKLKSFLYECIRQKRIPEIRDFYKAMRS